MRMRSPNFMKGVDGLPCSMVSIIRRSARQDEPAAGSRLDTVPEPMIVPARRLRVRAAWAMSCPKSKFMSAPALGWPNGVPFSDGLQRQMQLCVMPGGAQLIRRHGDWRKGRCRFGLEKAEALGQLGRDQIPQADVVYQHHQQDMPARRRRIDAHGNIAGDHRDLGLEIDAVGLIRRLDILGRADEIVRAALIHQRILVELRRHLGAPRLAHQFDMIEIGRSVSPLIGPRQRRHELRRIERKGPGAAGHKLGTFVQPPGDSLKLRTRNGPAIQRRLQGAGDIGHFNSAR